MYGEFSQGDNPAKEGNAGGPDALEEANLIEAQTEFRRLYKAGLLSEEYNFINNL